MASSLGFNFPMYMGGTVGAGAGYQRPGMSPMYGEENGNFSPAGQEFAWRNSWHRPFNLANDYTSGSGGAVGIWGGLRNSYGGTPYYAAQNAARGLMEQMAGVRGW